MTYLKLREECERDTAKALFQLHRDDDIQNYAVQENWVSDLEHAPDDHRLFKDVGKDARESYNQDVAGRLPFYRGEKASILLSQLEKQAELQHDFRNPSLVPKTIIDEERAIMAAIARNPALAKKNQSLKSLSLRRLLAVSPPFLSAQFDAGKTLVGREVVSEKSREIIRVVDLLESLSNGQIDGIAFGKKLRQKEPRRGVLALALGEADYLAWQQQLERMDEAHEKYNKAGPKGRKVIDADFFEFARDFLGRIGVVFDKSQGSDGRQRLDPEKAIVPDWDFGKLRLALELEAVSLLHRPEVTHDKAIVAAKWSGAPVDLSTCLTCVHRDLDGICAIGHPVQFHLDDIEVTDPSCDGFVAVPARIRRMQSPFENPENTPIFRLPEPAKPESKLAVPTTSDFQIPEEALSAARGRRRFEPSSVLGDFKISQEALNKTAGRPWPEPPQIINWNPKFTSPASAT